jgi:hypothetical protein
VITHKSNIIVTGICVNIFVAIIPSSIGGGGDSFFSQMRTDYAFTMSLRYPSQHEITELVNIDAFDAVTAVPTNITILWLVAPTLFDRSSALLSEENRLGFARYVAVCRQLYCRCYTVLHLASLFTLHVSAYMAIFRCVGCFIFVFLKESASLVLLARGYTLDISICVFLFCSSSLILLFLACVCVSACLFLLFVSFLTFIHSWLSLLFI